MAADQDQVGPVGQLLGHRLGESPSGWRQNDDPRRSWPSRTRRPRADIFHRLDDGRRLHNHPGSTAKGIVISRPVPIRGILTDIVYLDRQQTGLHGAAYHALIQRTSKHAGEDRQDVETHAHRSHTRARLAVEPSASIARIASSSAFSSAWSERRTAMTNGTLVRRSG